MTCSQASSSRVELYLLCELTVSQQQLGLSFAGVQNQLLGADLLLLNKALLICRGIHISFALLSRVYSQSL